MLSLDDIFSSPITKLPFFETITVVGLISKLAKGKLAAGISTDGNGFTLTFSEGSLCNHKQKVINLDYSQAVNALSLLLLTHKEYSISVQSELEILK